jgi:hypothetical protein
MNHSCPAEPDTLNHEKGLDSERPLREFGNAVGNGSICVMARKRFLPKMNQTRRQVVVP